jgi:hypothetical protein
MGAPKPHPAQRAVGAYQESRRYTLGKLALGLQVGLLHCHGYHIVNVGISKDAHEIRADDMAAGLVKTDLSDADGAR